MNNLVYAVPAFGVLALIYTFIKASWVSKQDAGEKNMQELAGHIADGAMAFLKAEWKILSYFVIIAGCLLAYSGTLHGTPEHPVHSSPIIAIAFVIGAVFSATAGYIGMNIATKANVRTAHAAKTSLSKALQVSFTGGSVMGLGVAGLAVLGLGSLFIVFYQMFVPAGAAINGEEMKRPLRYLQVFRLAQKVLHCLPA